jgi:hypothetical protein
MTRSRWVSLAKALDVPIFAIDFPVEHPTIHARRRADADGRGFGYGKWLEVAERHWAEYEPVEDDEGFDAIVPAPDWETIRRGWYFNGQPQETK